MLKLTIFLLILFKIIKGFLKSSGRCLSIPRSRSLLTPYYYNTCGAGYTVEPYTGKCVLAPKPTVAGYNYCLAANCQTCSTSNGNIIFYL